jgi:hypothetical protein
MSEQVPTQQEIVKTREDEIDTLSTWANEKDMSPEDQKVLQELADEAKHKRERDGLVRMQDDATRQAAELAVLEESEVHGTEDWHTNPDAH